MGQREKKKVNDKTTVTKHARQVFNAIDSHCLGNSGLLVIKWTLSHAQWVKAGEHLLP